MRHATAGHGWPSVALRSSKPHLVFPMLGAGFTCTRAELSDDIKALYQMGLFDSVNARVVPTGKGNKFKVGAGSQPLAPLWHASSAGACAAGACCRLLVHWQ